jgi:imidazolonepropionase-like amidohydrolase
VIKTCSTGAVHSSSSDPGALEWTDEELEALIDEAHRHGRRVAVHAHAPEGIRQAIRLGGDSIEHGMLLDEPTAKIMADSKVPLVPTVTAFFLLGSDEATDAATRLRARAHGWKERHVEAFKTALAAGVRIATGSDCAGEPFFPFGANAREIEIMVDYGMSPLAALEASTVTAAATIGREDVGAIRPGMTADLLVVDGNPEQDISSLRRPILVTQGGRIAVDKRAASPLPLTA